MLRDYNRPPLLQWKRKVKRGLGGVSCSVIADNARVTLCRGDGCVGRRRGGNGRDRRFVGRLREQTIMLIDRRGNFRKNHVARKFPREMVAVQEVLAAGSEDDRFSRSGQMHGSKRYEIEIIERVQSRSWLDDQIN